MRLLIHSPNLALALSIVQLAQLDQVEYLEARGCCDDVVEDVVVRHEAPHALMP